MQVEQYNKAYHRYMVDFMSYRDDVQYENTTIFSEDQLSLVVPMDVLNWMKERTFGTTDPRVVQEEVEFCIRSSTLKAMKKAISWYMPERVVAWSV